MPSDTTNPSTDRHIRLPVPRRSWFMHCSDSNGDLGVCVIGVEQGSIVIYAPNGSTSLELDPTGIAEFRAAFDEAISVAEADLRERAAATVPAQS